MLGKSGFGKYFEIRYIGKGAQGYVILVSDIDLK